jgi:hypothetical protein
VCIAHPQALVSAPDVRAVGLRPMDSPLLFHPSGVTTKAAPIENARFGWM